MTEPARTAGNMAIARAVGALVEARLEPGEVLALYAAKGTEVDVAEIAEHARGRGIEVVYPRVVEGDRVLVFHAGREADLAVTGRLGLREPTPAMPEVGLERIAAFVIPGIAFDRAGGRVGWGMGHYDATLARHPAALRIGVAFECQIVEHVPREAHDIAMNYVVTEVATYAVA